MEVGKQGCAVPRAPAVRALFRWISGTTWVFAIAGYLPLQNQCGAVQSSEELCLVGSLYFLVSSIEDLGMTCCSAAKILLGELAWQGVLHKERSLSQFPEYVAESNTFFVGIDDALFRSIVHESHVCWTHLSADTPLFGVPPYVCTAFDAWLSGAMWAAAPALGIKFYSSCVQSRDEFVVSCRSTDLGNFPSPDEGTYARAQEIVCGEDNEELLPLLQAHVLNAGLPESLWPETVCGKCLSLCVTMFGTNSSLPYCICFPQATLAAARLALPL